MESDLAKRLLERVKQMRAELGLSQEEFAEQAGMDYKHYQQVEAGRKIDFRMSTLEKLAKGFGLEPWELLHPSNPTPAVAEDQAKYSTSRKPRKK